MPGLFPRPRCEEYAICTAVAPSALAARSPRPHRGCPEAPRRRQGQRRGHQPRRDRCLRDRHLRLRPLPSPHEDYGTVGYDSTTGRQLWASRYDGIGGADLATAIAVSPDAHTVFVTGESDGPLQDHGKTNAYATVAYDAARGKQLWASRHNGHGTFDNFDYAKAVAVSPGGGRTVFVTGEASTKSSLSGYATVAYSAATGKQKWVVSGYSTSPEPKGKGPCDAGLDTIAYRAATGKQLWLKRVRAAVASGGGLAVSQPTDTDTQAWLGAESEAPPVIALPVQESKRPHLITLRALLCCRTQPWSGSAGCWSAASGGMPGTIP